MPPDWVKTLSTENFSAYMGKDLNIQVEKNFGQIDKKKISRRVERITSLLKNLLRGVWNSTRKILVRRKLGRPAFIDFLLDISELETPIFLRVKEGRERKTSNIHIFLTKRKLKEIKAVNRIKEEILLFSTDSDFQN